MPETMFREDTSFPELCTTRIFVRILPSTTTNRRMPFRPDSTDTPHASPFDTPSETPEYMLDSTVPLPRMHFNVMLLELIAGQTEKLQTIHRQLSRMFEKIVALESRMKQNEQLVHDQQTEIQVLQECIQTLRCPERM